MSRAAFFDILTSNPELNAININEDTIFPNYAGEERPSNTTPFIILRWGETGRPHWQEVKPFEPVTVWVHWPAELTSDYTKLIAILDKIDDIVREAHDVVGADGYTMSFVEIEGRSADYLDDGFNTIAKYGVYQVFSRRSE
jgi:hypothetical protein